MALQHGQTHILYDPFNDPPNPDLMYTRPTVGATVFPFTVNAADLSDHQVMVCFWRILTFGKQTGNSYSLMESRLGPGVVYSPHIFSDHDITYYVLSGKMTFLHGERVETATEGALVFILCGAMHAAMVATDEARCLNLHAPGGFEEYVGYRA